jgi:hypothetical protein
LPRLSSTRSSFPFFAFLTLAFFFFPITQTFFPVLIPPYPSLFFFRFFFSFPLRWKELTVANVEVPNNDDDDVDEDAEPTIKSAIIGEFELAPSRVVGSITLIPVIYSSSFTCLLAYLLSCSLANLLTC